jgi:hypothetical protein
MWIPTGDYGLSQKSEPVSNPKGILQTKNVYSSKR